MSSQRNFLFSGRRSSFLITGGGTGIGLALAEKFLSMGHEVIVVGRRKERLIQAKAKCPQLIVFQADVSTEKGRTELKNRIENTFPEVNVLVNNAGVNSFAPHLTTFNETDWDHSKELFNTNFLGLMHLTTLLLPHLLSKPDAMIINVSSIAAFLPLGKFPDYCASKGNVILSSKPHLILIYQPRCTPSLSLFATS
jgi:uncharacterized oxidoreductase